jgi:hypothetical protein
MTPLPAGHLCRFRQASRFQKRTLTRAVATASLKLRPWIAAVDQAINVEVVGAADEENSFKTPAGGVFADAT